MCLQVSLGSSSARDMYGKLTLADWGIVIQIAAQIVYIALGLIRAKRELDEER